MSSALDKVNVKQGTASQPRFSNGNTLPLTALPHALTAFAPQTSSVRGSWFYHPTDRSFEGIRLTHQPSPWMGDFSYLTFMPQSGLPRVSPDARWSGFRPENAELHPHFMQLYLLRYGVTISLAPTDTGAVIKLDFDKNVDSPRFAVTPANFDGEINIDVTTREIYGYTTSKNERPKAEYKCYFVFKFNCNIIDTFVTDGNEAKNGIFFKGVAAGANVGLSSSHVEISFATSYISYEQARFNLSKDSAYCYDEAKAAAKAAWENVLSKIEVSGDAACEECFYSCLYRAFLYPTKLYETDKDGKTIHVVPETGVVKTGKMYTNNGFWDTFRTVYPLYSLIAPETYAEIIEGWLNFYDDTGYLPRWPSPSEAGCMPGTLIEPVLADAVIKNLLPKSECKRALAAMVKNAEVISGNNEQGRKCVHEYQKLGYVPYDLCCESVNETLDCAYGDYCIAQVASYLGLDDLAAKYSEKSKNYKNLFDHSTGFMRARATDGTFRPDFDKYAWGRDNTEGSAYQSSVAVQHDMPGLASLYGGIDAYLKFIDDLVAEPPIYHIGGYGGEIHEMTEMAAADFGQCAISNQPSFHIPFIYSELGDKNRTAELVKKLIDGAFSARDDGFPGDEDNGTMACWYIFASLGFYPFCPGRPDYVVSGAMFEKEILHINGEDIDLIKILKNKLRVQHKEICTKSYK